MLNATKRKCSSFCVSTLFSFFIRVLCAWFFASSFQQCFFFVLFALNAVVLIIVASGGLDLLWCMLPDVGTLMGFAHNSLHSDRLDQRLRELPVLVVVIGCCGLFLVVVGSCWL